jgi:hypothetical protein
MDISSLEQLLKLIEKMESKVPGIERCLAENIINSLRVPYFRMEQDERIIADILGIETRKITDNVYLVERVFNHGMFDIVSGDFLIAPQRIKKRLDYEEIPSQVKLQVLRIKDNNALLFEKKVDMNLRIEKENHIQRKNIQYIKATDFSAIEKINPELQTTCVIDLRLNSGGRVAEMRAAYKKIFGTTMRMFENKEKGSLNFRADILKGTRKAYLIVDVTTCSSAEIFAGVGQKYAGAILVGTKMYGKDMICKRKQIGEFVVHVPETKFYINGKSVKDIVPDYRVDNIFEYSEDEILDLCCKLEYKEAE